MSSSVVLLALLAALGPSPAQAGVSPPAAAQAELVQPEATAAALAGRGLVDARVLAPDLEVRLKYAVPENFMGEAVYGAGRACYLQRAAAEKLARAQEALARRRPGFKLLLGDCLRPRAVQRRMWGLVVRTAKQPYVANPDPGSMHNHGAAVDVSIADASGAALDMGTPFDHFGPLAQPRFEARYVREGKLTTEQVANRRLLREVMTEAGWRGLPHEWWHFDAFPVREVRARFPIVEAWPDLVPATTATRSEDDRPGPRA